MARANLEVQSEVREAFVAAQANDSNVRSLKLKIEGETIVLEKVADIVGNVEEDFNNVYSSLLASDHASFVLFSMADSDSGSGSSAHWLFICWVPDTARVRDKMLYSSSKDDLKRALGIGYFLKHDVAASTADELTWANYQAAAAARTDGSVANVLTSGEKMVREEEAASRSESSVNKSTAMGVLPFQFPEATVTAFTAFAATGCEEGSTNWLELALQSEAVLLTASKSVATISNDYLPAEARFVLYRPSDKAVLLVYYCPESTPVRVKMTMSSAKATVVGRLAECGVAVTKSVEVREAADFAETIEQELATLSGTASGAAGSPAPDSVLQFSNVSPKPTRPGRGKARISKFVADS